MHEIQIRADPLLEEPMTDKKPHWTKLDIMLARISMLLMCADAQDFLDTIEMDADHLADAFAYVSADPQRLEKVICMIESAYLEAESVERCYYLVNAAARVFGFIWKIQFLQGDVHEAMLQDFCVRTSGQCRREKVMGEQLGKVAYLTKCLSL